MVVVLTCVAGVAAAFAPIVFFFSVFGDPYPRAFVERRPDGYYAQLRACENDTLHLVEVYPDDGGIQEPDPLWVATQSGSTGAESVQLFNAQPGLHTTPGIAAPDLYEVTINRGQESESSVVVEQQHLEVGQVSFGGRDPMSRADYDAMNNSGFGCA